MTDTAPVAGSDAIEANPAAPAQAEEPKADLGFPPNTSTDDMTEAQQLAYWKNEAKKQTRINRERGDYDSIKAKADQLDALTREQQTDHERALADARTQASKDAFHASLPRLVSAELRARAVTAEVADEQIDLLDLTKFVTDSGDLDTAKIDRLAANLKPAAKRGGPLGDFTGIGTTPSDGHKSLSALTAERREALVSNLPKTN